MHPPVDLRARALGWHDARRVPLAQHQAVIVPYVAASPRLIARCFHIFIDHCAVMRAFLLPGQGKRRGRWCCGICRLVLRNKTRMVEHALYHHGVGVCAAPLAHYRMGHVHSRERKARMPWRLSAPDLHL
jgi:hypothetical protein